MVIHEFYYNEDNGRLYIEFSTDADGDNFYRILELSYDEIELYSPDIISEEDLLEIDDDYIVELVKQYLINNDLPDEIVL
jgi:hypothetical protein